MKGSKTRQEAIDKTLFLMSAYYNYPLTEEVVELYHSLWADHELSDIDSACYIWMNDNKWFPKASEILKIIEKNKGPVISIEAIAQQQWRVVLKAISSNGINRPPVFPHPVTALLVKNQFPWSYLCSMEESDLNWEEKRWSSAFNLATEANINVLQIQAPAGARPLKQIKGVEPLTPTKEK